MDVKIVFLIVCLCALAITSTEAGIPRCCMKVIQIKPRSPILKNIQRCEMQEIGPCDIRALVLYIKGFIRPLCVNPGLKPILEQCMKKRMWNKKHASPNVWESCCSDKMF